MNSNKKTEWAVKDFKDLKLIFIILGLMTVLLSSCKPPDDLTRTEFRLTPEMILEKKNKLAAKRMQDEVVAVEKCKSEIDGRKNDYVRLMAAGELWGAARAIGNCHDVLKDAELKEMVSTAEKQHYLQTANDRKKSYADRNRAIEMLSRDYPEKSKEVEKLRTQLERAEQADRKKAVAAEASRRRRDGVSIGMSKEEVLQSSWGRPRKVNTTTHSYGSHEQWVYDGGYLYFRDGTLTTIQN